MAAFGSSNTKWDSAYPLFTLPHGFNFDVLSAKAARENLHAFIQRIPERMSHLIRRIGADNPTWSGDYTKASLESVGSWMASQVAERGPTQAEVKQLIASSEGQLRCLADEYTELTVESISMCVDIGIYVGECLLRVYPKLRWDLEKNRRHMHYNRPCLRGFRYSTGKPADGLEPILFGSAQAFSVLRGKEMGNKVLVSAFNKYVLTAQNW